jgi:hypothetical protein
MLVTESGSNAMSEMTDDPEMRQFMNDLEQSIIEAIALEIEADAGMPLPRYDRRLQKPRLAWVG